MNGTATHIYHGQTPPQQYETVEGVGLAFQRCESINKALAALSAETCGLGDRFGSAMIQETPSKSSGQDIHPVTGCPLVDKLDEFERQILAISARLSSMRERCRL